jgi:DeoR/GlpR family transcriptional regulator of sugar metabolism
MKTKERLGRLTRIIQEHGGASVAELSKEFGVSEVTIRRDLDELEKGGIIHRIHGGAVVERSNIIDEFRKRTEKFSISKSKIGRTAADLIDFSEGAIFIDSGTTAFCLAQELKNRQTVSTPDKSFTIVVNSLNIAMTLADVPYFDVFIIGGYVRPYSYSCVAQASENDAMFNSLYVEKCFIGVNGISLENGLFTTVPMEVNVKTRMAKRAKQVIVIADSSKFGKSPFSYLGPLKMMNVLVTDSDIPKNYYNALTEMGIKIIIAE